MSDGLHIEFTPLKQTGPKIKESFLVPKKKPGQKGPDYYLIIMRYVEIITEQINPQPNHTLWYRGFPDKMKFSSQPLGINQFYQVPRHIARFLGYTEEGLFEFKGHSLRRTSATIMMANGATGKQLQQKMNHTSEKSCNEYLTSSKRVKQQNANFLAGYSQKNETKDETKEETKEEAKEETKEETKNKSEPALKRQKLSENTENFTNDMLQIFNESGVTFTNSTVTFNITK